MAPRRIASIRSTTPTLSRRHFHILPALRSAGSPGGSTEDDKNVPRPDNSDKSDADKNGTGTGTETEPNTETEIKPESDKNAPTETEKEKGDFTDAQNADENLFGETNASPNGEGQGRKKRVGNGPPKSRTLRSRRSEGLPPVQLPSDFRTTAVSRIEDLQLRVHEKVANMLKELIIHPEWSPKTLDYLDGAAYLFYDGPELRDKNARDANAHVALSYWRVAGLTYELQGRDALAEFIESHPPPLSISRHLSNPALLPGIEGVRSEETKSDIRAVVEPIWDLDIKRTALKGTHPAFFEEIATSLRAVFALQAPKNLKASDIQRPATVINVGFCKGFIAAQAVVRRLAAKVDADVLHLRAHDLAHIIGTYVGQNVILTQNPVSQLAYRAAQHNGRAYPSNDSESHDEDGSVVPYTQIIRQDRLRKDSKTSVMTMDEFLNGTSKSKPGELWEDLKINSVLEELVHAADSEGSEQRPLIVHIDDFHAINLDLEAGSSIIGKIRKVVDGLWVDGRKIALVGTCSSKGVPKAYQAYLDGLREVGLTERLINLPEINDLDRPVKKAIERIEELGYIEENERNITDVLLSMLKGNSEDVTTSRAAGLGLASTFFHAGSIRKDVPEAWKKRILSITEVYRIATFMIGMCGSDVFNTNALKQAITGISNIEGIKRLRAPHDTSSEDHSRRSMGFRSSGPGASRKDKEADHEEQLLSGLVNAKDIRTTFASIHAPKETIESIRMLTTLSLIQPEAFSYGVLATERIPGCLLYGPPGTGKTLLAKAVAKESGAHMIEVSAASINNMYVGESEKLVRALFRLARKKEPLVIFIDEADSLLGARGGSRDRAGTREVITQFLREWDGVDVDDGSDGSHKKTFIMVATNRPFDLDEAVLRRLPRKLLIDLPREPDRAAILRIHLRDEALAPTVDLADLARRTPLYSGSDLKNVCVAAAMAAVKEELAVDPVTGSFSFDPTTPGTTTAAASGASTATTNESKTKQQQQKQFKKRVLQPRHFDAALKEIAASVSEDMATLTAIRRFDERYGDSVTGGARRKGKRSMGFEVVPESRDADGARVRVAAVPRSGAE
ncbi:hypothetical protein SLS62_005091 [Diatrype stigma]|uniref:AAA+ ATPase domain-containing protein n=1 Tax=Diatrype stigma TaxID=117547 RepID=A0AAN9UTG1_9PEZI